MERNPNSEAAALRQRGVAAAIYAAHLLLVALLNFDFALSWLRQGERGVQGVEWAAVAAAVWLFAGIAAVPFLWRRPVAIGRAARLSLVLLAAILTAAGFEAALLLADSGETQWKSYWVPGSRYEFFSNPSFTPGAAGAGSLTTNEWGLRGPSVKLLDEHPGAFKIITVGGSTTECWYLDDSEQWAQQLMDRLNQSQSGRFVYVGNTGVAGHSSVENLQFIRSLELLDHADLVTLLVGVNDLSDALAVPGRSTAGIASDRLELLEQRMRRTPRPPSRYPYFRRLQLYQLAYRWRIGRGQVDWVQKGKVLDNHRAKRAKTPLVPLPDISIGISEYRVRISEIGRLCRKRGLRCVFITQPSMWRAGMPAELSRLLWLGGVERAEKYPGFVDPAGMADGMKQFNDALLQTCREDALECFDLAPLIPKDTTAFFDGCHFNENGARLVANAISDWLLQREPFQ